MCKTWAEMTDVEKGALLLAHHEGKTIEVASPLSIWRWERVINHRWYDNHAYRVRPPEPVRETVTKHIWRFGEGWLMSTERIGKDTHRITFDTIGGEPDCNTIRMERVND